MEVNVVKAGAVNVVKLAGEIDGKTAPEIQEKVLSLVQPGVKVLLDMSGVPFMSSAGLRMLLSVYRQVTGTSGKVAITGVAEEIRDTMSVTGFLKFFVLAPSEKEGIEALEA